VHIGFPSYFHWREELASLSLVNKQMMQIHTFFIALFVFLNGILCLMYAEELVVNPLGIIICKGLTIFWGIRLIFQLFVYSPALWKGKTFETSAHIVFTGFWCYLVWIFGSIGFVKILL
jgi:succinate-acetate transporter protein